MTLQQLKYALTLAETGSMNKAAESLFISQPALTNTIRVLEDEAGVTIFTRTNRGVSLTSEGSDFLFLDGDLTAKGTPKGYSAYQPSIIPLSAGLLRKS